MNTMRPNFEEIARQATLRRKTQEQQTDNIVDEILKSNLETSQKIDKTLGN